MDDYRAAALDPSVRLLLDFAVRMTRDAHEPCAAGIAALRADGWSDEAILEAVEIIGFFNYYNRLVDALGVEPEPEWEWE
jgi:uncharacterized peroxidase-related enzyme